MRPVAIAAILAVALGFGTTSVAAAERSPLAGKTIEFIVTGNPGDGYDLPARIFARYVEKLLGEGTKIIVHNNTEGGGRIALNQLFSGPTDGTLIAMVQSGLMADQLLGLDETEFDFAAISWIGKLTDASRVLVSGPGAPYADFQGLLAAEGPQTVSSFRATSFSTIEAWLLNAILGIHLQPVFGFDNSSKFMSVLRGEVRLTSGNASSMLGLLASPEVKVLLFSSRGLAADSFGTAPSLHDVAPPEQQPLVDFLDAMAKLGRLIAAPPGLSPEIAAAWQEVFAAVMADPAFLAEAATLQLEMAPMGGPEIEAIVDPMFAPESGLRETLHRAILCGQARAEGSDEGC